MGRILVDLARRGGLDVRSLAKKAKVPLVILQGGSRRPPRAKAIARLAQVVSHLHP
ncbi:MAG: hypothetical protein FJ098_04610 [Deltaproteobacteria bacterium]|nr:hypothetical protein [Deltaproteobacteria bacterium]